ncbi:DUF5129 domain-containing protein [Micrococcus antarcticus]
MGPRTRSIRIAGTAAALSLGLAGALPAAQAATGVQVVAGQNLESVTIEDSTGKLNEQRLRDALDELDFNEPTDVAIYARNGEYSDDINTKTLEYAKSSHPEWISGKPEDYGDYWADGLFIITLSIEGEGDGQIGTYFGEDRKVSESSMESIHEAGYDDFNLSRWTDGVIAVADQAAVIMNRPWYQHPALWISTGVGGLVAAIIGGVALHTRSTRRKTFAEELHQGTLHLTNVTMDLEETELAARTLPSASGHAAELEQRFTKFMAKYRACFAAQQALEDSGKKERSGSEGVRFAKEFRETAQSLDLTDDAIIAAAALYTRSASWEEAWHAQTEPLEEDLDEIRELLNDVEPELMGSAAALVSYREMATTQLGELSVQLKEESITVDQALDGLSELRAELTEKLDVFAQAQIEVYAESAEEKADMQSALKKSRYESGAYDGRSGTILDVLNPVSMYWRVGGYHHGYSAGVSAVAESREAASSSGGVSGGYSGGGSFSGAGGSSRF